ncbi:MAG: prepilin-type N-terminal cleavage/methylation domain-containing protein, partial [Gammaproteobacteria bacterium]|nr:prepilin-type N-terminal cleavage/methylation domain-containing protein [Gammaproteobacteria bacterium]NIT64920.1 prepilin-type N-terminal cleavage/methylation domain-containing protein [Gammaproteobacteria bacterium]NIV21893.1 prepilin-type N-terminal cleavage/methylation domain-containing protein [Gammaproteobacteria bacterium]NIY33500.1 prepilin-type N-terminal cleavage/methylation domain-containing protein [Gammaproteobacteria bacterium]
MMTQRPGFTMIELLIVVVIVSILAALAIPTLTRARERGFYTALRADLKHLQNQQEIYYHTAGL